MNCKKNLFVVYWIFLVMVGISADFDCKRAKLNVNYIRNCHDGEHIITILDNSTLEMNDKCEIFTFMCAAIDVYHKASFEVSMSKNDEKHFEDKVDLCYKPKKSHNLSIIAMAAFSVPYICPVAFNYTSCGNGKKVFSGTDDSEQVIEHLWAEGGFTKIYADIIHDTGKSCMEAELQLTMN